MTQPFVTLTTTNGVDFIIDAADRELVERYRWFAFYPDGRSDRIIKRIYIKTTIERRTQYLHRLLLDPGPGQTVDHINLNPLDNRRENLRFATRSEQNMNRGIASNNTSGFKGVCCGNGRWIAYITIPGFGGKKRKFLGGFDSPEEAAAAYDRESLEMYGDFARPNAA